jgi:hypothetical protein
MQTEQETQSENPNLLENPVAIPIAPIQLTATAIQKSSENILQLPPLPKITTTGHSQQYHNNFDSLTVYIATNPTKCSPHKTHSFGKPSKPLTSSSDFGFTSCQC